MCYSVHYATDFCYDRGVKFGLTGGGRAESIMVSAPPLIAWKYTSTDDAAHQDERLGAEESRLLRILKQPIDWANLPDSAAVQ
jgi:coproporphyrinogen III oxidase